MTVYQIINKVIQSAVADSREFLRDDDLSEEAIDFARNASSYPLEKIASQREFESDFDTSGTGDLWVRTWVGCIFAYVAITDADEE